MCQGNYRPQRSCGQGYVFTRVCDSVNGGGSPEKPPWDQADTPPDQGEPPGTKENPPPEPGRTPLPDQADPPPDQGEPPTPSPREEDGSIRSMSSRYASYWNAFLLNNYVITRMIGKPGSSLLGVCVFILSENKHQEINKLFFFLSKGIDLKDHKTRFFSKI